MKNKSSIIRFLLVLYFFLPFQNSSCTRNFIKNPCSQIKIITYPLTFPYKNNCSFSSIICFFNISRFVQLKIKNCTLKIYLNTEPEGGIMLCPHHMVGTGSRRLFPTPLLATISTAHGAALTHLVLTAEPCFSPLKTYLCPCLYHRLLMDFRKISIIMVLM